MNPFTWSCFVSPCSNLSPLLSAEWPFQSRRPAIGKQWQPSSWIQKVRNGNLPEKVGFTARGTSHENQQCLRLRFNTYTGCYKNQENSTKQLIITQAAWFKKSNHGSMNNSGVKTNWVSISTNGLIVLIWKSQYLPCILMTTQTQHHKTIT